MTKKKLNETLVELCKAHNASEELTKAIDELTRPKVGGGSNVNDYTCFDADGNVTHIFCAYHKKWEPVVDAEGKELFKKDDKSKNGYTRSCTVGDTQWREQAKIFNQSKAAIMTEVLDEVLTGAEAKEKIAELEEARKIHLEREDGLGSTDKPCEDAE